MKERDILNKGSKVPMDTLISKNIAAIKKNFEKEEIPAVIEERATICSNLALLYWKKENYPDSRKFFLSSLQEYEKIHDDFKIASTKGALGSLFIQMGEYILAKRYSEEAYEYWSKSSHLNERIACLQNLGIIYLKMNDEQTASEYILIALRMAIQLQDEIQFAQTIQILLEYYEKQKRYDMLLELKMKALEFWEQMGLLQRQFKTLIDLGVLSQILEGFSNGTKYFKKAFNIGYNSGNIEQMFLAEGFLAECYLKLQNIDKAKYTYLQAFKLAVFLNIDNKHQEDVNSMRLALLSLGFSQEDILKAGQEALKEVKKNKKNKKNKNNK